MRDPQSAPSILPGDVDFLLQCQRFQVVRLRHTTPSGNLDLREVVLHPGAVAIVPMVTDDQVCLVRNFRKAVGDTLLELPAGTLEGESPLETARRELHEETGYTARDWEPLHTFWMSPGILREAMHVFVATGLTAGDPHREATEQIENLVVSWDEAVAMCMSGKICDAKSIAGILLYDAKRRARFDGAQRP